VRAAEFEKAPIRRYAAAGFMPEVSPARSRDYRGFGMVSPNVGEMSQDVNRAHAELASPEHVAARRYFQAVEDAAGTGGVVRPAIGMWQESPTEAPGYESSSITDPARWFGAPSAGGRCAQRLAFSPA
jgi:hypothetical protein